MFRNRAMQVSFVKTSAARKDDTTPETSEIDWDKVGQIAAIAQETAETVGKVVVTAYIAKKLIDTACTIAVIAAEAKLK